MSIESLSTDRAVKRHVRELDDGEEGALREEVVEAVVEDERVGDISREEVREVISDFLLVGELYWPTTNPDLVRVVE